MDVLEKKEELPLSIIERAKRENLVQVVHDNKAAILKTAIALAGIRDEKLYRETHANFADFVRDEFQFEKSHAYRLCDWATVAANVSPIGENPGESHARELKRLPDEQQADAWEESLSSNEGTPTAKDVAEVVERRLGGSDPRETRSKPAKATESKEIVASQEDRFADCMADIDEIFSFTDSVLSFTYYRDELKKRYGAAEDYRKAYEGKP